MCVCVCVCMCMRHGGARHLRLGDDTDRLGVVVPYRACHREATEVVPHPGRGAVRRRGRDAPAHPLDPLLLLRRVRLLVLCEVVCDQRALGAAPRDDRARVARVRHPHRVAAHQRTHSRRAAHTRVHVLAQRLVDLDEGLLERLGGRVLDIRLLRQDLGQVLDDELGGLLPLLAVA